MRLWVDKCGWTLSDHGLRRAVRSVRRAPANSRIGNVIAKGPILRCDTEEAVFAAVGVPYRAPCDRNCGPVEAACPHGPCPRRPPPVTFATTAGALSAFDGCDDLDDALLLDLQVGGLVHCVRNANCGEEADAMHA